MEFNRNRNSVPDPVQRENSAARKSRSRKQTHVHAVSSSTGKYEDTGDTSRFQFPILMFKFKYLLKMVVWSGYDREGTCAMYTYRPTLLRIIFE
jgi:endo-beta-N-acetylglucosaminidase D